MNTDSPKYNKPTTIGMDLSPLVKEVHDLQVHVHPPVPNPAPLGLIGFGLTTALLQLKHTRIGELDSEDLDGVDTTVLGFAMFFGGLLQVSMPFRCHEQALSTQLSDKNASLIIHADFGRPW